MLRTVMFLVLAISMLPHGAVGQVRASRADTVNVSALASRLAATDAPKQDRRRDFAVARRVITMGDSDRSNVLRNEVEAMVRTSNDLEVVAQGAFLLVEGARANDSWGQAVGSAMADALARSTEMAFLVLETAQGSPPGVQAMLVRPALVLFLNAEDEHQQRLFGEKLVLLGAAGRAAFENAVSLGQVPENVAAWIRFTTREGG